MHKLACFVDVAIEVELVWFRPGIRIVVCTPYVSSKLKENDETLSKQ